MKIMFLDTSNTNLVIGIVDSDKLIYEKQIELIKEHSKYAMPELEKAFTETGILPNDIDKIMVITGPGSYTGVRIGVTIAKTYAWALKKVIIGISSLKAMALSAEDYDFVIPMIDARREFVFSGIYNKNCEVILDDQYISLKNLKSKVLELKGKKLLVNIGDFFCENELENFDKKSIKLDVLKIVNFYKSDSGINPHKLNPVYLKMTEAEENLG